ncbi:hypothetical protein JTB14_009029 [Gonioctena quinquepunctata]|nr:hypothetical protein JTB14_009029 [Gonioctena quinquepunctata]
MVELRKALKKGCMDENVPDIQRYGTAREEGGWITHEYDGNVPKTKREASGWPAGCLSNEARSRYIGKFKERKGVLLDRFKIWKNPGIRSIAKLIHNSPRTKQKSA